MGKEVSYEDLQHLTSNFCKENFIGRTQFGILYRGKISKGCECDAKDVTVKMWITETILEDGTRDPQVLTPNELLTKMKDEIRFLELPLLENNKNVAKVLGYCFEEGKLGVVYDLNPLDTVRNLVYYKAKLGWGNRIKVVLGLTRLLKLLHGHEPQFLIRNLSARHIMVDQDFNPVLVDFAMIEGGDIGGEKDFPRKLPSSPPGYRDLYVYCTGRWTTKTDSYCFGVILLELILKRTYDTVIPGAKEHHFIDTNSRAVYRLWSKEAKEKEAKEKEANEREAKERKEKRPSFIRRLVRLSSPKVEPEPPKDSEFKCDFVNGYFRRDPDFHVEDATELTMLALKCVEADLPNRRPEMEEVVGKLEKLHIYNPENQAKYNF